MQLDSGEVSDVSSALNQTQQHGGVKPPIEVIEHKEKQKQLRSETRYFEQGKPFADTVND